MSSTSPQDGQKTLTINEIAAQLESGSIRPGALIEGTLGEKEGDFFTVALDEATGRVPADEVADQEPGAVCIFFVEDVGDEQLQLSLHKAERLKIWNWLEEQRESGTAVSATVISESRGALAVEVHGLKALLAHRDLEAGTPRDISILRGQKLDVQITQVREKKAQIIVSQRALTEGTPEERKAATLAALEDGQVLEGEVRRLANFGAFVDIGGVDGLLHVKDMKWKRVNHPSDIVQVGDIIQVKVLSFTLDSEKISLGMKQLLPDPWSDAEQRYRTGRQVTGDVVGLTDFGAFIMLDDGIEGLVHISEMSWTQKVQKPNDILTPGDRVDAWVLRCDIERRRLGLTLKNPEDSPWVRIQERFPVGEKVSTTVTNVVDFGLFVELADGLEGLVHISDFSWTPLSETPQELYEVGQSIDVMVLDIDAERGRANLGIKQLQEDEVSTRILEYSVGQVVDATVTGIQSYGVFAELTPGLEGMIHVSELSNDAEGAGAALSIDQMVRVEITAIDVDEKRISLRMASGDVDITPTETVTDAASGASDASEAVASPEEVEEAREQPEPAELQNVLTDESETESDAADAGHDEVDGSSAEAAPASSDDSEVVEGSGSSSDDADQASLATPEQAEQQSEMDDADTAQTDGDDDKDGDAAS